MGGIFEERKEWKSDSKILSENLRMSIDTRFTRLNNNVLVIGGAGTGKSQFFVKPNLFSCLSSVVVTDPKGELLRDTGNYLETHGYDVKVLNLIDMDESDGFNPFKYVKTENDVIKLITNIIANTNVKGASKGDPFWEKSEGMLLQALFLYVMEHCPPEKKNFSEVLRLLNKAKILDEDGSGDNPSELDMIFNGLDKDDPALVTYNKVMVGAADTKRSIIITAQARLAYLENDKIQRVLDHDDMNLSFLGRGKNHDGKTKTALFCVIPDSDKSYNFVVGMLYTLLFQELYFQADFKCHGRLPIPVMFWMDEFANIALPEDFCSLLSTMRSREISCNIIIQNLAQIKALFEKTWETITGNCDTFVYLGGNEQSTHKYVAELLGKWTIEKRSSGETLGRNGSSSKNIDVLGRELMMADEVGMLPNSEEIVKIRGQRPVRDLKYKTFTTKEFQEATALGYYECETKYGPKEDGNMDKKKKKEDFVLHIANEAELAYYREMQEDKQMDYQCLHLTPEQALDFDFAELNAARENPAAALDDPQLAEAAAEQWVQDNFDKVQEIINKDAEDRRELAIQRGEYAYEDAEDGYDDRETDGAGLLSALREKFTAEQIAEADAAIDAGLSEEQVASFFKPELNAEEMKAARLLLEKLNAAED